MGQTQPAACFYMTPELRISYKEGRRRGQGAKGGGRRERKWGRGEGKDYVTICGP